ncbi:hypothetical protein HLB09_17025, partial [Pseudokineococcus marinus]|nr:hypothetical protein [Pseudokineococcus marinus]
MTARTDLQLDERPAAGGVDTTSPVDGTALPDGALPDGGPASPRPGEAPAAGAGGRRRP